MHHVTSMTMLFFRTIVLFLLFGDGVLPSVHCEFTTLLFGTFSESFDNGISKMLALKQQTELIIYCFVANMFELESKSNVAILFNTYLNIKRTLFPYMDSFSNLPMSTKRKSVCGGTETQSATTSWRCGSSSSIIRVLHPTTRVVSVWNFITKFHFATRRRRTYQF